MLRKASHADGESDRSQRVVLVLYGQFLCLFAQRVGSYGGVLGGRFGQDNAKLLSSITANHIVHPEKFAKQVCNRSQNQITRIVAEGIVEALEVIEVDEQDRYGMVLAHGALHFPLQRFLHEAAIEQPGQRIANGLVTQGLAKPQAGQ